MNRIDNRNAAKGIGKLVIAIPVVTFCLLVSLVLAQSGRDNDLSWSTIDDGRLCN